MSDALKPLISKAIEGPLSRAEAREAFSIIMDGHATQAQMGGLLIALRARGETVDEYASAAQVMRERCRKVRAPKDAIDVVGTGGDGKSTLNISTATAIVVAGAGVPVAKHGNRNLSSRSGTADALSVLGVNVMAGPKVVETAIAKAGIGFMMAPVHHPAVRHVMPVRQELGTRTVFNILGPLTNPASVKRQLTGSFSRELIRPMAETLAALGCESAWVVHGDDGADEVSISGPTSVASLENGAVREFSIVPGDAGLPEHPFESIIGGSPEYNAEKIAELLRGETGPYRDSVVLNASAALVISGKAGALSDGAELARKSIDSGAARSRLDALVAATAA